MLTQGEGAWAGAGRRGRTAEAAHESALETALNEAMTEHLGHEKIRADFDRGSTNVRNGTRPKTMLSGAAGEVQVTKVFHPIRMNQRLAAHHSWHAPVGRHSACLVPEQPDDERTDTSPPGEPDVPDLGTPVTTELRRVIRTRERFAPSRTCSASASRSVELCPWTAGPPGDSPVPPQSRNCSARRSAGQSPGPVQALPASTADRRPYRIRPS